MRRILTGIPGGFPFEYSDFEMLQYAPQDVIEATIMALGFKKTDKVLMGNILTIDTSTSPGTYITTEGYAYVSGKLCYVPAQTVQGNGVQWVVVEEVLGGAKTFLSGSSHNTYVRDKLVLQADLPTGGIAVNSIPNMSQFGWKAPTIGGGYSPGVYGIYYRVVNNMVYLWGSVKCNTTGGAAFTIDVGTLAFGAPGIAVKSDSDWGRDDVAFFTILTDGQIQISSQEAGKYYLFNSIINVSTPPSIGS